MEAVEAPAVDKEHPERNLGAAALLLVGQKEARRDMLRSLGVHGARLFRFEPAQIVTNGHRFLGETTVVIPPYLERVLLCLSESGDFQCSCICLPIVARVGVARAPPERIRNKHVSNNNTEPLSRFGLTPLPPPRG